MDLFDIPSLPWLAGGVALVIAEILLPGMFLLWVGIAAFGTGLVTYLLPLPFGWQVGLFGAIAIASVLIGIRKARPRPAPLVNTQGSGLVGRRAIALGFSGTEGRVRLGDSDWPARLVGAAGVASGVALLVEDVDGLTLIVRPIDGGQVAEA